jgi:hypothetical protein
MGEAERLKTLPHPKTVRLGELLNQFWGETPGSRVSVFTQFRNVAYELRKFLGENVPGAKVSVFIGQATTRHNVGLASDLQGKIAETFRKGTINCIIATSVGEEGLDIGEVDLVICFDTPSSALKNVQRVGRTGRKRTGRVIYLLSEGIEERGLSKAKQTRAAVRQQMTDLAASFVTYEPREDVDNLQMDPPPECDFRDCAQGKAPAPARAKRAGRKADAGRDHDRHFVQSRYGLHLKAQPFDLKQPAPIMEKKYDFSAESRLFQRISRLVPSECRPKRVGPAPKSQVQEPVMPMAEYELAEQERAEREGAGQREIDFLASDDDDGARPPVLDFLASDDDFLAGPAPPPEIDFLASDDTPRPTPQAIDFLSSDGTPTPTPRKLDFLSSDSDDDVVFVGRRSGGPSAALTGMASPPTPPWGIGRTAFTGPSPSANRPTARPWVAASHFPPSGRGSPMSPAGFRNRVELPAPPPIQWGSTDPGNDRW